MREIGAFSAKTHLSQILESVVNGESFAITKHGKIIAFLTPATTKPQLDITQAICGIKALRKKIAARGVKITIKEIDELKSKGRK